MSIYAEYVNTESALKELQARLEKMRNDPRYLRDIEFVEKLRALMTEYDRNEQAVLNALYPEGNWPTPRSKGTTADVVRRNRKLKIYVNPHTQERVETKGGNHKTLKEWKAKWGAEAVESWVQPQTE